MRADGAALVEGLAGFASDAVTHTPGKTIADLAVSVTLGGDAISDTRALATTPQVFGAVASGPVHTRRLKELSSTDTVTKNVVAAVAAARKTARTRAWELAGEHSPLQGVSVSNPLIIDLDATILIAHSDKENAAGTFKRTYGFHPLLAFLDHGATGTGEVLAMQLRKGNAGSNTASDHMGRSPGVRSPRSPGSTPPGQGKTVLVRTDGGGGTKEYARWLAGKGVQFPRTREVPPSLGFTLPMDTPTLYKSIPADVREPAINADGQLRDVAELTGLLNVSESGWPAGARVIVRRERPHPGAQLRFDDVDGYRLTAFITNTRVGQLSALELRHRRRARCEDRIRCHKGTGLRNLPLKKFNSNIIWCQVLMCAADVLAHLQLIGFAGTHDKDTQVRARPTPRPTAPRKSRGLSPA